MKNFEKIGFLGGTFDPFHMGHLNLAVEMLEKGSLDSIWICPTRISPFKTDSPPIDIKHRLNMLKLPLEGLDNVLLNEIEAHSSSISYTYQTLCRLKEQFEKEGKEFILILSDDLLIDFEHWHEAKKLLEEFSVLIAQRNKLKIKDQPIPEWIYSQIKNKILPVRTMEVSSSEIRHRLKNKLYCNHLLPLKTLDYIYKYKLYS